MKIIISIDNGVSGSIAIIKYAEVRLYKTPTVIMQDYTKSKQNITRLDVEKFISILNEFNLYKNLEIGSIAIIERPMVNPGRWKATKSALRCLEATLTVLESFQIPYRFIDSKEWQRELLPKELKKEELKKASLDIGVRLFPNSTNHTEENKWLPLNSL